MGENDRDPHPTQGVEMEPRSGLGFQDQRVDEAFNQKRLDQGQRMGELRREVKPQ